MLYKVLTNNIQKNKKKIDFKRFEQNDYMPFRNSGFSTKAIHVAQQPQFVHGSVNVPIHCSSTAKREMTDFDQKNSQKQFDGIHYLNPTMIAFEKCFANLEQAQYALSFSSGNGATSTIMHLLSTGDHVLLCDVVYGGTFGYLKTFAQGRFKVDVQLINLLDITMVKQSLRKDKTKLVWIETPTNPALKVIDIQKIVEVVKEFDKQIMVVVDNTFCSSFLQQPLQLGADISVSSVTKYTGGHSDIVMGAIAINDRTIFKKLKQIRDCLGTIPSAMDTFLALRGVKTLQQRVIVATRNAYHIAHFLADHELIDKVSYPGLKEHPQHQTALKQMRGFGGMIAFFIKNPSRAKLSKFLRSLKIIRLMQSLGGVESCVKVPAFMNDKNVKKNLENEVKPQDSLIRFSVGNQSLEDLIGDLDQALRNI